MIDAFPWRALVVGLLLRRLPILSAATALLATPALPQTQPQTGPFPLNSIADREHDGPQGAALRPSIQALQTTLAELLQLQLQTRETHWSVSGTLFHPLHEVLQEHDEGLSKYAGEAAERLQDVGDPNTGADLNGGPPLAPASTPTRPVR